MTSRAARSRPAAFRAAAVLLGGAAVVAGGLVAARALAAASGALTALGSVGVGVTTMLVFGSLVEWLVHRYLMHRRVPPVGVAYDLRHRAHHWLHYRPDAYLKDRVG